MITPDLGIVLDVCYYIGTDDEIPSEFRLVERLVKSAYSDLEVKTGVNWLTVDRDNSYYDIALEAVRCMAWLSYYGDRDDAKNTAHLKATIDSKIFSLQMSPDAVKAREAGT